jgi:peptide/nickel transport system permease protein
MAGSVLRYALRGVAVVFGVMALTFLLLHLAPGDFASFYLGPTASAEQLAALRQQWGLDQPIVVQFGRWLWHVVHGDFGRSLATGRAASSMLAEAWPATALLVGLSILLSQGIGLVIGALQANARRPVVDRAVSVGTVSLAAVPGYWLGLMLIWLLSYQLRWLPSFGAEGLDADFLSPGARLIDRLRHLALPLVTLTLVGIGTATRYARTTLGRVRGSPFVAAARSRGLTEHRIVWHHQVRHGLIPIVALIGLSLPALFSGAVFIETIFAWPGVGQLLVQAVQSRDYPVVMAATTVSAALVVAGSLLAEVMLVIVDPRLRAPPA